MNTIILSSSDFTLTQISNSLIELNIHGANFTMQFNAGAYSLLVKLLSQIDFRMHRNLGDSIMLYTRKADSIELSRRAFHHVPRKTYTGAFVGSTANNPEGSEVSTFLINHDKKTATFFATERATKTAAKHITGYTITSK